MGAEIGSSAYFHARLDYRTGRFPVAVAIADVNGDRKRDLVTGNYNPDSGAPAANTVSVLLNRPGLCNVQEVRGMTLSTAKRTLARVDCRVGNVGRAYSKIVKKGRVISQTPKPGKVLRRGAKVNLVVSLERMR